MICEKVLGNLTDIHINEADIERVKIEWFEADKRIIRRTTDRGTEVGILLKDTRRLNHGDILCAQPGRVIAVEILPAKAVVLEPRTLREMAVVCYHLGNRHAPLFLDGDQVIVPFDQTLVDMFGKLQIPLTVEKRRFQNVCQLDAGHHH